MYHETKYDAKRNSLNIIKRKITKTKLFKMYYFRFYWFNKNIYFVQTIIREQCVCLQLQRLF